MIENQITRFLGNIASQLKTALCNFIAPATCNFCSVFLSTRQILCNECTTKIEPVTSLDIFVTKKYQVKVYAKGLYKNPLKKLIVAKRWNCIISSKQLAHIIMTIPNICFNDYDYIIPIPLHWKRHALRGFNQAYEMAHVIHKEKNIALANILQRTRHTNFQSDLTHDQRIDNLKDAFLLACTNRSLFHDKKLLIIDDVMTTGTTITEAAKTLRLLKPKSISAVVACRA